MRTIGLVLLFITQFSQATMPKHPIYKANILQECLVQFTRILNMQGIPHKINPRDPDQQEILLACLIKHKGELSIYELQSKFPNEALTFKEISNRAKSLIEDTTFTADALQAILENINATPSH